MILTLTPNPSLDLLFEAERLVWDDANRVDAPRRRAGGQGINLVRAARALGADALAVAPLGGRTGAELRSMLEGEGAPLRAVEIEGETRVFVGVRTSEGSLLLNPRGPTLRPAEVDALLGAACAAIGELRPAWVVACGSIPPGGPPDLYARLAAAAREHGARFVPDCDGEPLRRAASHADLLAPNAHEAERLSGLPVGDAASALRAARALLRLGPALAVVKLGPLGAVAATGDAAWHARGPALDRGSAVGAGDAFLAALLAALHNGEPPPAALRAGVAAGSAVLLSSGSDILRSRDARDVAGRVTVTPLAPAD